MSGDLKMEIRLVKENEIEKAHDMLAAAVRHSFPQFYPHSTIDYVINQACNLDSLKRRAKNYHFYVAVIKNKIVGCGIIAPYRNSAGEYLLTESILMAIMVHPDFQGQGIGTAIIKALENDEYGKRAKRIEIPAAINAIPFYKKLGYEHKNGTLNYDDGHFYLEKFFN